MKKDSLNGILTALKQEDCVLLIGSGISVWSGLPSWKGFLNELADFMEECGIDSFLVKREIAEGDLLQAASYGFDRLTKPQIETFMPRACRYGKAEPHEIHKKILDLGANCFITTNYDKLIEMGIEKWQAKKTDMVTNRQLAEMGRILQARAENFVYKPHGDIEDMESIILTREQYRSLLVDGERHMALETLKTLMVSRPLVCLGFGLKDPDFLYIRDILSNIYQGNVRDHYAIMADVEEAEVDYWERNYGIHLVGYETRIEPDGSRSHASLLELLDIVHDELHGMSLKGEKDEKEPSQMQAEVILAFVRYAAGFRRYEKAETEFGIRIYRDPAHTKPFGIDQYNRSLVESFLTDSKRNAVLIGAPGAGKSYAMRRAAAAMAEELSKKCLEENGFSDQSISFINRVDFQQIVVPVYIDLKLYDGDLKGMIEREFSKALPLEWIMGECQCKIFLDSFNEMPREYWDNGRYRKDFEKVIARFAHAVVVVGSRTADGLEAFGFPVYVMDEIDRETIHTELEKRGMATELNRVMQGIVSKPFYFQYIVSGKIDIKNILQPKHFYREFFWNLQKDFTARFGGRAEIGKALSVVAYRALDAGIEAFPAEFIYDGMDGQHIFPGMKEKEEIVNWLIYKGILIPHSNGKITFVHQTVTEYLAAKELMEIYWRDPTIIREKARLYRWDQVLFFMINLLPNDQVEEFMDYLFAADFLLAFRSVQYMEFPKEGVIRRILEEIEDNREIRRQYGYEIENWLEYELRISEKNEEDIRRIIDLGGSIGGSAAGCLWKLRGDAVKDELMELLFQHAADDFFCERLARTLSRIVEEPDLKILLEMADHIQEIRTTRGTDRGEFRGFVSALALIMQKYEEEYILSMVVKPSGSAGLSTIRSEIFCAYLEKKKTALSFVMAVHLFMMGYRKASATMYLLIRFSEEELPWDIIAKEHIDRLADCLYGHVYAFHTLREILNNRTDLQDYIKQKAESYDMLTRAAVLASIGTENQKEVFQILEWLPFVKEEEEESEIPFYELLGEMELVWRGREVLFVRLLMLKKPKLLSGLMGSCSPPEIKGFRRCEIRNIDWWLDWIEELEQDKTGRWREWQSMQIGGFLTQYTGSKTKTEFLERFNDRNCPYRKVLLKYIIPKLETRSDDFNEDGIQYILEDLKKSLYWEGFQHHFLARAADHKFIVEKLMPLLEEADGVFRTNLLDIIETAGRRHGKRYLV